MALQLFSAAAEFCSILIIL